MKTTSKPLCQSFFTGNVKLVIYTCGSEGAYAFTKNAQAFAESEKVKAVDTTGAGDGFIGSFLYALKTLNVTAESLCDLDNAQLARTLYSVFK